MSKAPGLGSTVDEMVAFVRDHPSGVGSQQLAEIFLKFIKPEPSIAHRAVAGALSADGRCTLRADDLWVAGPDSKEDHEVSLMDIPWVAAYPLLSQTEVRPRIFHISVWAPLGESPTLLCAEWLVNPESLPSETQEILRNHADSPFAGWAEALAKVKEMLENGILVFATGRHQGILASYFRAMGEAMTDDTMLLSQLLRIAGLPVAHQASLESCCGLFGQHPVLASAVSHGNAFADCVRATIERLASQGVTTRTQLEEQAQRRTLLATWDRSRFSLDTVARMPLSPGVYGFTDEEKQYIYVGKARSLRNRLLGYFRDTEESPDKLARLRKEAIDLTIHPCGSELESLILEHRLIRKYAPRLNKQLEIGERKGIYGALQDCVILLPHAEEDKGMSFWHRRGQKIILKPFDTDFADADIILRELDYFFYSHKLPPSVTDFPECEIFSRWVLRRKDSLPVVPVHRLASAKEVFDAMCSLWPEVHDHRGSWG